MNPYLNLVGKVVPHKLGEIFIQEEIKPKKWDKDFLSNKAVKKVYGGLFAKTNFADKTKNGVNYVRMPLIKTTDIYKKFKSLFFQNFTPNNFTDWGGCFDEICVYGFDNNTNGHPVIRVTIVEEMCQCFFGDYEVTFTSYNDGIMIVDITIDKNCRNKGYGTDIMNKLYDISEDNNIPIYLIPYPSESFPEEDEFVLVDKLKKWYSNIGFGPVSDNSLVWCNFE